jgi:hypothetical protein
MDFQQHIEKDIIEKGLNEKVQYVYCPKKMNQESAFITISI